MSGGQLQGRRSGGPRQPLHAQHVGHGGSRCRHAVCDDAYGVTEITGGGLEHIVKQMGSAGTSDPLNQRATCGWKATGDDWITIEPLSGGEKGIFAVHLSFGANDTGALRTGRVVFEAGTYSETYTLTQKAQ